MQITANPHLKVMHSFTLITYCCLFTVWGMHWESITRFMSGKS